MDAYVVIIGNYPDEYENMAAFTNEKEAEKYADYLEKKNGTETHITGVEFNPEVPVPKTIGWDVHFDKDGTITKIHKVYDHFEQLSEMRIVGAMHVVVNNADKDTAIALAIERRKEFLSRVFGL